MSMRITLTSVLILLATWTSSAYAQSSACLPGYVWRTASPADTVCVTPQSRALVAQENQLAGSRRVAGLVNGAVRCLQGFVWREAFSGDQVCVIPAARDRVNKENRLAARRKVGGGKRFDAVGKRTIEIGMTNSRPAWDSKLFTSSCGPLDPFPGAMRDMVGWGQAEHGWLGQNCFAFVLERAVQFDRTLLDQVPGKRIIKAVLTYDEAEAPKCDLVAGYSYRCWQSGTGAPERKPQGCVVVRAPTMDWIGNGGSIQGRVPAAEGAAAGIRRIDARTWDVTSQVSWQLDPRTVPLHADRNSGPSVGFGLVLSGGPSINQLTAQDNTVCVSEVQNVAIEITYEVLSSGVFVPPR